MVYVDETKIDVIIFNILTTKHTKKYMNGTTNSIQYSLKITQYHAIN